MNCMKCGREVEDGQVFCPACQEDMEKYPVRPGTVVLLPKREETHYVKKSTSRRRAAPTPEEQIRSLKARLRLVTLMLLVSLTRSGFIPVLPLRRRKISFSSMPVMA